MKHYGLQCPNCYDEIYSMHRHDFRHCSCGYCFVDGGFDYFRWGFGDLETGGTHFGEPLVIQMEIEDGLQK